MVNVEKISKTYLTSRALDDITFHAAKGQFAALLGANGAGKTTLIRILATLTRPTSGTAKLAGLALGKQSQRIRQQIGVMSHTPFLYGDLSAEENLRFYGRMYGPSRLNERINELLARVDLEHRRYDLVRTFSRGMQQRLSLARALLHCPRILLLDEPFAGLDLDARTVLDELLGAELEKGTTILLTTHDLEYALRKAERILLLRAGKLVLNEAARDIDHSRITSMLHHSVERPQP